MNFRVQFLCVCLILLALLLPSRSVAQRHEGSHAFFALDRISEFNLRFTEEEWGRLQPAKELDWDVGEAFGEIITDAAHGKEFRANDETRPGLGGYLGRTTAAAALTCPIHFCSRNTESSNCSTRVR